MTQRTLKARLTAEERRQSIIDAAGPLFAEHGFRGVTTKQIAEGVGVSEALLYRHFPSKESLFQHVQDHLCKHPQEIMNLLMQMPPGTQSLVNFVFMHVKTMLQDEGEGTSVTFSKLMLRSITDDGVFAKLFLDRVINPWREFFSQHLAAADAEGSMTRSRNDDMAFWFCHHLTVHVHLMRMSPEQLVAYPDPKRLANAMTVFMLRGMGMKESAIEKHFKPERLHAMEVWDNASY